MSKRALPPVLGGTSGHSLLWVRPTPKLEESFKKSRLGDVYPLLPQASSQSLIEYLSKCDPLDLPYGIVIPQQELESQSRLAFELKKWIRKIPVYSIKETNPVTNSNAAGPAKGTFRSIEMGTFDEIIGQMQEIPKFASGKHANPMSHFSIKVVDLFEGEKISFDLYVKLPGDRFLQIAKPGDSINPEKLKDYLRIGVKTFYIATSDRDLYSHYLRSNVLSMVKDSRANPVNQVYQTMKLGQFSYTDLIERGFSRKSLREASHFVHATIDLVVQTDLVNRMKKNEVQFELLQSEHATSTVLTAALLLPSLGFDSKKSVSTIGVASFLHDIGLVIQAQASEGVDSDGEDSSQSYLDEVEELFTDKQNLDFTKHAEVGADFLKSLGLLDEVVIQAVRQHHERSDGSGFPKGLRGSEINFVASIVGLADEAHRMLRRDVMDSSGKWFEKLTLRAVKKFAPSIGGAFLHLFADKKK